MRATHSRLLCALLLAVSFRAPVAAQESVRLSARQADRELRLAQRWLRDVYSRKGEFSLGTNRPACDEARGGRDCFLGEHECPRCVWRRDGSELARLAAIYDRTAQRIASAPPGMSIARLDWLAGQRVGLRVRRGELAEARTAARECRAQFWWCEALRGLVEQRAGAAERAEEHFRTALRSMPPGRACYWKEIALYRDSTALSIGHDAYGRWVAEPEPFARRPCPQETELAEFWALADPLWSLPGNDRRAEHYARVVDTHIHQQFLETFEVHGAHRHAHHSAVVRHGWPRGFEWSSGSRSVDPIFSDGIRLLYGRGQGFTVPLRLAEALRAGPDAFVPRPASGGESYAPGYGPVANLELQAGFFRRGAEPGLAVRASVPAGDPAEWQAVGWDGVAYRSVAAVRHGTALSAWLSTPWQPQVVSLEGVHARGAWRGRSGITAPASGRVALSSVVLLSPEASPAATLDEAIAAMLPTTRLPRGARAALYWEVYAEAPLAAELELMVRRTAPPGLLSRLLREDPPPALHVRWNESLEPKKGSVPRTFQLDLERLAPGEYQLELVLTHGAGEALRSATRITIGRAA